MWVSNNLEPLFGSPLNRGHRILASILGPLFSGRHPTKSYRLVDAVDKAGSVFHRTLDVYMQHTDYICVQQMYRYVHIYRRKYQIILQGATRRGGPLLPFGPSEHVQESNVPKWIGVGRRQDIYHRAMQPSLALLIYIYIIHMCIHMSYIQDIWLYRYPYMYMYFYMYVCMYVCMDKYLQKHMAFFTMATLGALRSWQSLARGASKNSGPSL